MKSSWNLASLLVLFLLHSVDANAQIARTRTNTGGPVDEVFLTPNIVTMSSVANLPKNNINVTIMHVFGIATNGAEDLFGLDAAANIRFGLDYGVTDHLSIGIGRSRYDKLYDFRFKANLLRQTKDGRMPFELAIKGDAGIMTLKNGFDLSDRLNFLSAVLIARKFSDRFSVQITPMYSHFNTVFIESDGQDGTIEEENGHVAVGLGVRIGLSQRMALLVEYIPVFGPRSDGTKDEFAVALNLETGGHVFQLFFKSSQWLTEQHVIARNRDNFFEGDLRFGFNVNRFFGVGTD